MEKYRRKLTAVFSIFDAQDYTYHRPSDKHGDLRDLDPGHDHAIHDKHWDPYADPYAREETLLRRTNHGPHDTDSRGRLEH